MHMRLFKLVDLRGLSASSGELHDDTLHTYRSIFIVQGLQVTDSIAEGFVFNNLTAEVVLQVNACFVCD